MFQDHVLLAQGTLSPPLGLIAFHYQNALGSNAMLFVGVDPSSSISSSDLHGGVDLETPPQLAGAIATTAFLHRYVPVMVRPTATPPPHFEMFSVNPKVLLTSNVIASGVTISGEVFIQNIHSPTTFYVFACTTNCTASYKFAALRDSNHQRGQFLSAQFNIHYDYSPEIVDTGGYAFELIGSSACTPDLSGVDPLENNKPQTLKGDFGVPVVIYGWGRLWPTTGKSQRFGLNPRGGFPYIGAMWVQELLNPVGASTIGPDAFRLPTPMPAQPTAVPTKADSVMLGFEKDKGKGMVYILPGGDAAPVEIWDYVVTPVPRRAKP